MTAQEKTQPDRRRPLAYYTHLGCPLTHNRTAWCFRLCAPDEEGHGRCGRLAPHHLRSRIQQSIERYNENQRGSAPAPDTEPPPTDSELPCAKGGKLGDLDG
jgi:hypothetical protein